ncbi:MAG: PH domain-containing protein [Nanoarchaeota archaeon]
MEKPEKILFELRPQMAVAIIPVIIGALITSTIFGAAVGLFTRQVIYGVLVFFITGFFSIFFRLMNLRARRYLFYENKAEFYEGFINIVQRTVRYTKVTDCVLIRTLWDRVFGTGTIRLVTAGHEGYSNRGGSFGGGIIIQYINNPDETYKKVETLLRKHN